MKHNIFLFRDVNEKGRKILEENNCNILISGSEDPEKCRKLLKNAEGIFTRNENVSREIIDMAPNLKVIAKHGVGYDNIDIDYATKKKIQVVYVPKGNLESVADMAMLHILASARKYRYSQEQFIKGNYNVRFEMNNTYELGGKVLGLVGCGNIAKAVAKRAAYGFGMRVMGYDPYAKFDKDVPIRLLDTREELLRISDFVSVHLPSLPDTIHSFGLKEFKEMKDTAYFINTSRGNIVCENELIEALQKNIIAGAGLDVFEEEPLPVGHPFLTMSNVSVTPHCAGLTNEASENNSEMGAKGIVDVLNNRTPQFPVNHI